MKHSAILIRNEDQKQFKVIYVCHWSEIEADDGERDRVKWYGVSTANELYVSDTKGYGYTVENNT